MLVCMLASAAVQAADTSQPIEGEIEGPILVGEFTRSQMEEALPDWMRASLEAIPDLGSAAVLVDLDTSARVTIFFGSWCEDSRREIARLWSALDLGGGGVFFEVTYIGVDRDKREPVDRIAGREILYVPTIIVEMDGIELGRIVEESPRGIEVDLLALLEGRLSGWISVRDDLPSPEHDSAL